MSAPGKAASGNAAYTVWPDGIVQVRVPLPFSLKWVNSYLIPDSAGWSLVDPGLHTEAAELVWEQTLAALNIQSEAIHTLVLTHQHPDHYGLAGWFQALTGAPVLMSRNAHAYALRLWGKESRFGADLTALYKANGMPTELLGHITAHLDSFVPLVSPQPVVSYVADGEKVQLGGRKWLAIETFGHAAGHLSFYDVQEGRMLCGDQVLPEITPNVSVVPGERPDPLADFLAGLHKLSAYPVRQAYPGHREPFTAFHERLDALHAHHTRRLNELEALLAVPHSGYATCVALFGERITGNAHNLRFAMSETLAHLYHLETTGHVAQLTEGVYAAAAK